MAKKQPSKKEEPSLDPISKIEAIKQLIFGENIEQYNSEFDTLKKEIEQKKEALETYVDQVREELMQSIDSLSTDVNIRITDLEDAVNDKTEALDAAKVSKAQLGDLLIKLGEKIRS